MTKRAAESFHVWMMGVCVAVFAAQSVATGGGMIDRYALYGPAVAGGQWWRLLTWAFVHANVVHLGLNMLSLRVLGRLMEPLFDVGGRWRFPLLYMGSLLGGSVGVLLVGFHSPTVGASGAVFGVLGAAAALPLRCGFGANRFGVLPWLAFNLAVTFAVPGISVGGHVGGLLAGFVLGWLLTPVGRLYDTRAAA